MLNLFKKKQKTIPRSQPVPVVRYILGESSTAQRMSNFRILGNDIDQIIASQYASSQRLSREAYLNNDYVKGFVSQACINIIGHAGIKVQSKTNNEVVNKLVENSFRKWGKKGKCEVTGNLSFVDVQLLSVKSLLRDGEFFITKNIIDGRLELQLIEPSYIDDTFSVELNNSRRVINGVEVNNYGKVLAYYFKSSDTQRKRIAKENIIHGFIQDFIGQKRGLSAVRTALLRLNL